MRKNGKKKETVMKLPRHLSLVWLQGYVNGKTGTAALDDDQVVQSGYVQMMLKRFEGYAAGQIRSLDKELHSLSSEAEKLIMELGRPQMELPEVKQITKDTGAVQQRAAERSNTAVEAERKRRFTRKKEVIDRLIEIRTAFSEEETICQETLIKTAAETEEILASYCKGVLHKQSLTEKNIPTVNVGSTIRDFHESIEWTKECLKRIDEEMKDNYENP